MSATSILINVGAATAGAVSELARVDHALEGNEASAKSAAAAMKTQMDKQSAAMAGAGDASKRAAAEVDSSMVKMGDGADTVASKGAQAAGALAGLGDLIGGPFGAAMQTAGVGMQAAADAGDLMNVAVEGGKKAFDAAKTAIAESTVATHLQAAATKVAAAGQAVFNAVMAANPIILVVLAIIALIAIVVLLWKNWDTVTKALGAAWAWLKSAASTVFNWLKTFLSGIWSAITGAVKTVWDGLVKWLKGVWDGLKSTATAAFNTLKTAISTAWGNIKTAVTDKVGDIIDAVAGLPGKILNAIGNLGSLLYQKGRDLIQGLINGIMSLIGSIGSKISGAIPDWVPGFGRSAAPAGVTGAGARFMAAPTAAARSTSTVTINITTGSPDDTARAIKRILEGGDIRQGRAPGRALARAW